MLTSILLALPLLTAILLPLVKGKTARNLAMGVSLLEFGLVFYAWSMYRHDPDAAFLSYSVSWVSALHIRFDLSLNALSLLMTLLTSFLVPLILLSTYNSKADRPSGFYALILFMQMALMGVFMANDGFLFYVFWELALIPIYFICLLWGGENRGRLTFNFLVYNLFG